MVIVPHSQQGSDAVLDGVLHQRDQHHRRERRHSSASGTSMAKSSREPMRTRWISRNARAMSTSRPEVGRALAHLRQRRAQVLDEALQHPRGRRRVGLDQVLHVGERVEEEVRLDLRLHELQARLEHVLLQLVALGLGLAMRAWSRACFSRRITAPPPRSRSRCPGPC
jgi:hypothetical protein